MSLLRRVVFDHYYCQVRKLHAFVRERHPNAVFLETVVVNRVLVEQLEALADGAVAEASWFEVGDCSAACLPLIGPAGHK